MKKSKIRQQLIAQLLLYGFIRHNVIGRYQLGLDTKLIHYIITIDKNKYYKSVIKIYYYMHTAKIIDDLNCYNLALNFNTFSNIIKCINEIKNENNN